MDKFETIVGMEIHVELKTDSKMFCGCRNDPFFAPKPNIYTCPVCLGLPGALPVPNRKAVEWTIKLGLALNCQILPESKFDRKNYFYPDLPKGYQISQYDQPLCVNGQVKTEIGDIRIHRVHLEEDTGKLLHTMVDGNKVTLIDFNRSGVPLVEIVTEPDIRTGDQAKVFLRKLHQIIRYLEISDADMEKGTMRLEPNISVKKVESLKSKVESGFELPNYKVEVKNINSFNFVKKAIDYETQRQIKILGTGKTPAQETRGWNADRGQTYPQRLKETADDYRYFPDPDIVPMKFSPEFIKQVLTHLPELPDGKKERFRLNYGLSDYDSGILTENRMLADYYETAVKVALKIENKELDITPKKIANRIINKKTDIKNISPESLIAQMIADFSKSTVGDEEIAQIVGLVIEENPKAAADYKGGKEQSLMYLLGKAKEKNRNLNPKEVLELLRRSLTG